MTCQLGVIEAGRRVSLRSDSDNPYRECDTHLRVRELAHDALVVGHILIDCACEVLRGNHKNSHINQVERIGHLKLEDVRIPARHIAELNLHLHAVLFVVCFYSCNLVLGNRRLALPIMLTEPFLQTILDSRLGCRGYVSFLSQLS